MQKLKLEIDGKGQIERIKQKLEEGKPVKILDREDRKRKFI